MLAYAAGRPRIVERRSSPNLMLLIVSAHVALLAAVMSAKMDLPSRIHDGPTIVKLIETPKPPPPRPTPRPVLPQPRAVSATTTPLPLAIQPTLHQPDGAVSLPSAGEPAQASEPQQPPLPINPPPLATSTPAQPLTPPSDLKPPYPESKLLAGEEAVLTLRLTVDENGRVVGVDPIGRADPVFLAAARRHLMSRWRYKPAMQGGHAVASTLVVTLRFELDE